MGVPAFYRWLSEKYPKIIQDVLEERVQVADHAGTIRLPLDASKPNPSGLECDHLYIDMNGIIHPCAHPEQGPQPSTVEEMYENVCLYVDRLMRVMRPRKLLYLAVDGVAPRAKMNQQRARRFRSAQEARELRLLERQARVELRDVNNHDDDDDDGGGQNQEQKGAAHSFDSNVITPGTTFMLQLSDYLRFYIRKRISQDRAWKSIRVIFSDASIPGEGEHKIMNHVRLQRSQPGYDPNTVHILHGLDADLIMLALATHEAHFYISRELVLFGRKSNEMHDQRQEMSGFRDAQRALDEAAGPAAMTLPENTQKPLQRVSIPILREYWLAEFASCLDPNRIPFPPSFERLIDDIVFLCFFVGNDFLPHLPSLDIRDGALDFLFNVYKRILPGLGGYMTKSGGQVCLQHVDVILAEVGAIEDYVFAMKHDQEERMKAMHTNNRNTNRNKPGNRDAPSAMLSPPIAENHKVRGRAAKILESSNSNNNDLDIVVAATTAVAASAVILQRGHQAKEVARQAAKAKHNNNTKNMIQVSHLRHPPNAQENLKAAAALKQALQQQGSGGAGGGGGGSLSGATENPAYICATGDLIEPDQDPPSSVRSKRSRNETVADKNSNDDNNNVTKVVDASPELKAVTGTGIVGDMEEEFNDDAGEGDDLGDDDDVDDDLPKVDEIIKKVDPEQAKALKEKVKVLQQKQLDEYSKSVVDTVRFHEAGWKDRYYNDKCKANDISNHGGREHLFRSYIVGLCWVMKYYYDGCPSWKWYYPFHYAPFASDLKNIERFERDCRSLELSKPFNPVEQLMAVLPSDSAHAVPEAARWLMLDEESPIIDFYPSDVPVDPNGKAMPWLWVVLLPFIDEERLLAALLPTIPKWKTEELLSNARGLDDGYLYVSQSHPLTRKLAGVLKQDKSAHSLKTRLTDTASYGCAGFSGSVRPPLSNEVFSLEGEAVISPPSSAMRIERTSQDSIFADAIEAKNCVCVAFTEPPKLSHKSVLLPGARPPRPILTTEDKRVSRPRLNRGGGTIANLGGPVSNGQSYKSGYGSMNVNGYERDLAMQTGRGHEIYQTGMRAWGAMEPVPKRIRGPPSAPPPPPPVRPMIQNPLMHQQGQSRGSPQYAHGLQPHRPPPWQQQQQPFYHGSNHAYPHQNQLSQGPRPHVASHGAYMGQQHQQLHSNTQQQPLQFGRPNHQPGPDFHRPEQSHNNNNNNYSNSQYLGNSYQRLPNQPANQPQGANFRSFNQATQGPLNAQQSRPGGRPNAHYQQQQQQIRSRANADVMNSLRAQLSSTLRQNRQSGASGGGQR